MQSELFPQSGKFRLVRLGEDDVRLKTDNLFDFRRLILENTEMYPRIGKWLDSKVLAGFRSKERVGYLGFLDDKPLATAVIRKGRTGKFCHLKLDESLHNRGIGELFFVLMTLDLRSTSKTVNFTLPEHLWAEKQDFFSSFGFCRAERAKRQYRLFEEELFCSANFAELFSKVREKLPKLVGRFSVGEHSLLTQLMLSLRPEHAEKILSGRKTVEIRKRFSARWEKQRATLYACRPVGAIVGEASIAKVVSAHPDKVWEQFGHLAGCSREEFDAYVGDDQLVFALVLDNVAAFSDRVPIEQLSYLLDNNLQAPQSYLTLEGNELWKSAVSLAAALQGSLVRRSDTYVP